MRINSGGAEYYTPNSTHWAADCFFTGGRKVEFHAPVPLTDPFPDKIKGTEHDPLYQTGRRFFREDSRSPGYHIPVPPAMYMVRLHFAEGRHETMGTRIFDVEVEETRSLKSYQPKIREAEVWLVEIRINDGCLDIAFFQGSAGTPIIAAIEIEKTE